MKNAMKKIMSLVLVAMILVSALPFAASASEICTGEYDCPEVYPNHNSGCKAIPCDPAECHHGGWDHQGSCSKACNGQLDCYQYSVGNTDSQYHKAGCLAISKADVSISNGTECTNSYDCKHVGNNHVAGCPMIPCSNDASCDHGGWNHQETCPFACRNSDACHAWFHLDTCPKNEPEEDEKKPENNGPSFPGFPGFPNFPNVEPNKPDLEGSNDKGYYKLSGDVVLEICVDQNQKPAKTISIKEGIAADGRVNLNEVKGVVKYYYNAVDADTGIVYDGLYKGQTFTENVIEWVKDTKFDTVTGLYEAANNCKVVTIRVYISNAKLATTTSSSSSNADSTNPKTGDTIMMPVAVMAASASILAVAFYMNKKRAF